MGSSQLDHWEQISVKIAYKEIDGVEQILHFKGSDFKQIFMIVKIRWENSFGSSLSEVRHSPGQWQGPLISIRGLMPVSLDHKTINVHGC